MPSVVYAGVKYTQVRHAVQCRTCLDTVESTHVHDLKMCTCGSVGVDGGLFDGNSILGVMDNVIDRSIYSATVNGKETSLSLSVLKELKRLDTSPLFVNE
jgi:hypothetical protein